MRRCYDKACSYCSKQGAEVTEEFQTILAHLESRKDAMDEKKLKARDALYALEADYDHICYSIEKVKREAKGIDD